MTGTETIAVCALYEGDYHLGLGGLVNSLYRNGFRGVVWVGFRGAEPGWASPSRRTDSFVEYKVAEGCVIRFIPLDVTGHLINAKATFMLSVLREHQPDADAVCYFDVDIVVKCGWPFFENWTRQGVALCLDACYPYMPATHPFRGVWRHAAEDLGFRCRDLDGYANSGFVGVRRDHVEFLEIWESLVRSLPRHGVPEETWQVGDRAHPFNATDQDMLNVAMMASDAPLSLAGPEAMDFAPAGYIMSHAVLSPKPWARNYLVTALRGMPPTKADKMYWRYADGPIAMFSPAHIKRKRMALALASAIGRFYRRA